MCVYCWLMLRLSELEKFQVLKFVENKKVKILGLPLAGLTFISIENGSLHPEIFSILA